MVIVGKPGILGWSIQVGRWQGALIVGCRGGSQKVAKFRPEPVHFHTDWEKFLSSDGLAVCVELETVLGRVAESGAVIPLLEKGSRAESAETIVKVDKGCQGKFCGELDRTEAPVTAEIGRVGAVGAGAGAGIGTDGHGFCSGRGSRGDLLKKLRHVFTVGILPFSCVSLTDVVP